MRNTLNQAFQTAKNIALVALLAGIVSFVAGTHYQSGLDSHVKTVAVTVPSK